MTEQLKKISITLCFSAITVLSGCTTGVIKPPEGSPTMKQAYFAALHDDDLIDQNHENGLSESYREKKIKSELPSLSGSLQSERVLAEQAKQNKDFPMLPNPQVMLYVYPHYEGESQLPIRGTWTSYPLYSTNHYALPSEVQVIGDHE